MIKNFRVNKTLWLLLALLALIAAFSGVFNQSIYSKVITQDLLPGTISQDVITLIAGIALLFLSLKTSDASIKAQIVIMSLLAYLFYGYGIYVIEQVYNSLYILYMAIFSLSFWALISGLGSIDPDVLQNIKAPKFIRNLSVGFLIFTAVLFYSLWSAQLLPLMRTGEKIEFLYSIYILDMVFVLPAIIITAIMLIKNKPLGLILAPILFTKAFTLLFSVGLGGLLKPFYNQKADPGETSFYLILSVIFLSLAVLSFWKVRFQKSED